MSAEIQEAIEQEREAEALETALLGKTTPPEKHVHPDPLTALRDRFLELSDEVEGVFDRTFALLHEAKPKYEYAHLYILSREVLDDERYETPEQATRALSAWTKPHHYRVVRRPKPQEWEEI